MNFPIVTIFQLGRLHVFHCPSPERLALNLGPTEVFWQDIVSHHTYGPFSSVHEAMNHYTWIVSTQKAKEGQVIYVDFQRKKVIEYNLPKEEP